MHADDAVSVVVCGLAACMPVMRTAPSSTNMKRTRNGVQASRKESSRNGTGDGGHRDGAGRIQLGERRRPCGGSSGYCRGERGAADAVAACGLVVGRNRTAFLPILSECTDKEFNRKEAV